MFDFFVSAIATQPMPMSLNNSKKQWKYICPNSFSQICFVLAMEQVHKDLARVIPVDHL
jgi:hypothetical protein